jgi:putative peptidoglycan lipid II flippase
VRTPVIIGIISVGFNMLCNALLVFPLAHAGLALAASLSACLNASLLWRALQRKGFYVDTKTGASWLRFGSQLLFANLTMSAFLYYTKGPIQQWQQATGMQRTQHLFILMLAAGIIYLISLVIAGMRWHDLKAQSSV